MLVKDRVRSIMEVQWKEELENKPKLRTYKLFKNDFQTEDYVYCNDRLKRSLFAQICVGILPLRVETSSFNNYALNDRQCIMCPIQEVENELQFICRCPIYEDLRTTYFQLLHKNHQFLWR